ncbi:MAG: glutathione peroxidase [Allomuricauda sp.]|nr:MAG: glutathione peroxidase [Allomuricauda sp.]
MNSENSSTLYDIPVNALDGSKLDLSAYKGKYILFVNVASKCGFTPQYKELQQLSDTYGEEVVVVGSPCNQFAGQEPGDANEIRGFCELNFGVTFPLTEKMKVKGNEQHPLYQWLTQKSRNGKKSSSVKWNFQKYLVNPEGELVDYYYSITKPTSRKITKHFG